MTNGYSEFCAHEMFEQQAERIPETPALLHDGQQLTYGQLNLRSNQLARFLQRRGVGPEVAVAGWSPGVGMIAREEPSRLGLSPAPFEV